MKFGLMYNTGFLGTDPDQMIAVARHAEQCGFESFYTPEHIALYPGASVGPAIFPAATLDVLSKGRMRLLTVGVGALPGEAMAGGVDFATRGRRADEAIDVLRLLWDGDENGVSFDGKFFSFTSLCSFPKPLGRLPIHVGGSSQAAARRAGLRGDGYFSGGRLTAAERAAQLDLMRETARAGMHPVGSHRHDRRRRGRPRHHRHHPPRRRPRLNRPVRAEGPDLRLR